MHSVMVGMGNADAAAIVIIRPTVFVDPGIELDISSSRKYFGKSFVKTGRKDGGPGQIQQPGFDLLMSG